MLIAIVVPRSDDNTDGKQFELRAWTSVIAALLA
jgi:hypothetical protein